MRYGRLARRQPIVWAFVASAGKLPIAMAPLAMVFLGRQIPGGYTLGSVLAATYVIGEVVGASLQARWLTPRRLRAHLAAGLGLGATAFAALTVARGAPSPVLAALAFLAGAAPAASPGGLRSILIGIVEEPEVAPALSAEGVLTELIWAAAPALVVLLALRAGPTGPLALGALSGAAAAALVFLLPAPAAAGDRDQPVSARALAGAWPIYLTSAAALCLIATTELLLPALLEHRHLFVGWAGPLLAAFSAVSAIGAFCYGLRSWPGSVRAQSVVLLVITAGFVGLVALLPGLVGVAAALLAAGLFQSGVLVTRNLSLRDRLPEAAQAAGYSVMYAVQGTGYSLTAVFIAVALTRATPSAAVLGGAAITVLLTVVSAVAERAQSAVAEHRAVAAPEREPRG